MGCPTSSARQPCLSRDDSSPRSSASMSARVPTRAGSIWASRASWLTHAVTSGTAGRSFEFEFASARRRQALRRGQQAPLDHIEDLVAHPGPEMAAVQAPDLLQPVDRRGSALGDADQGKIGEDEAGRLVGLGRPFFPPCGQLLGDAQRRTAQMAAFLDAGPRIRRIRRDPHPLTEQLALGQGPVQSFQLLELGLEAILDVQQVGDVGDRVVQLGLGQWAAEPVGQSVTLGQALAQLPLVERRERGAAQPQEAGGHLRVEDGGRHSSTRTIEDLEILGRGVQHGQSVPVEDLGQRRDVDRQRVDDDEPVGVGELHQRHLGVVGALPVELGVDGVDRLVDAAGR